MRCLDGYGIASHFQPTGDISPPLPARHIGCWATPYIKQSQSAQHERVRDERERRRSAGVRDGRAGQWRWSTRDRLVWVRADSCGHDVAERSYLVKPYNSKWEDGILALEGGELQAQRPRACMLTAGSGLGALAALFERKLPGDLFPDLVFPDTHNNPVLKAAYVFSLLA